MIYSTTSRIIVIIVMVILAILIMSIIIKKLIDSIISTPYFKNLVVKKKYIVNKEIDKFVSNEISHLFAILHEVMDYDVITAENVANNVSKFDDNVYTEPYIFFSEFSLAFNLSLERGLNNYYDEELIEEVLGKNFVFVVIAARLICKCPMLYSMYSREVQEFIVEVAKLDILHKKKCDKLVALHNIKLLMNNSKYFFKNYNDFKSCLIATYNMDVNVLNESGLNEDMSNFDDIKNKEAVIKSLCSICALQYYSFFVSEDVAKVLDNVYGILCMMEKDDKYKKMISTFVDDGFSIDTAYYDIKSHYLSSR